MRPYARVAVWIFLILAIVSLIVGIIAKGTGFRVFGLIPLSYLRFTGACLLFVIAIAVVELAERKGSED